MTTTVLDRIRNTFGSAPVKHLRSAITTMDGRVRKGPPLNPEFPNGIPYGLDKETLIYMAQDEFGLELNRRMLISTMVGLIYAQTGPALTEREVEAVDARRRERTRERNNRNEEKEQNRRQTATEVLEGEQQTAKPVHTDTL